jgi:hypothetical protein
VQTAVNGSGTIAITGAALISHTNFEQVNVLNPCGAQITPTVTPTATPSPSPTPTVSGAGGPAPGDIPTLSGGMLMLLAVGLAALALFVLRRQ